MQNEHTEVTFGMQRNLKEDVAMRAELRCARVERLRQIFRLHHGQEDLQRVKNWGWKPAP